MQIGSKVNLLTGKYAGKVSYFTGYTDKNNEAFAQVRVQTGMGWQTVLVKPENISENK